MALLMNGPLEIQSSGSVSSVCLHPTKDLGVSIHEPGFRNVGYCSIFEISKQLQGKISTRPVQFNSGKHFSVALVYVEDSAKTIAIATYRYAFDKGFCYRIGIMSESTDDGKYFIAWQNDEKLDRGVKPKISASKNGTVAVIFEETYSINKLRCKIGALDTSQPVPDITWKELRIVYFNGVEPDVAINDNTIVLICRSGLSTLQTKVGTIHPNLQVVWGLTSQLPSNGINPTISINSDGYIVEIHQTKVFRRLTRNCGRIFTNRTIGWNEPSTYTQGEYPTVSINDDGLVLEMHKSNFGSKIYHSHGELRVTDSQRLPQEGTESQQQVNESLKGCTENQPQVGSQQPVQEGSENQQREGSQRPEESPEPVQEGSENQQGEGRQRPEERQQPVQEGSESQQPDNESLEGASQGQVNEPLEGTANQQPEDTQRSEESQRPEETRQRIEEFQVEGTENQPQVNESQEVTSQQPVDDSL